VVVKWLSFHWLADGGMMFDVGSVLVAKRLVTTLPESTLTKTPDEQMCAEFRCYVLISTCTSGAGLAPAVHNARTENLLPNLALASLRCDSV